jgi:hypothetical protein
VPPRAAFGQNYRIHGTLPDLAGFDRNAPFGACECRDMARAVDFSILGGLALIGAGAGVHLGWSAIGEINPLYFSKIETASFHGDLAPNRTYDPGAQVPAFEQSDTPAVGSCVGCRTYPVDYRPISDPAIERIYAPEKERPTSPPIELAAYEPEPPDQTARRKADLERVELYSRAPVSVEEAAVAILSVEAAEPAN